MKILFIGTVEFSKKALQKLIDLNAEIVGVCTKEASSFNSDFSDLTPLCRDNNIPSLFVENINDTKSIAWIKALEPDIIFCFGWSSLIKKELLTLTPMGVVGYHPAALPQNRGRHPLIWALALGLTKSASTFFFMEEGADDGDILSQREFEICYEDDAKILYDKVINIALMQIEKFIPQLIENKFSRVKQNHSLANVWRKRSKPDGIIDFRMSSEAIYNLVRALTKPYVGAIIEYNSEEVTIWKVEIVEVKLNNIEFGKVLEITGETLLVKSYDGAVRILEHTFIELPKVGEYL